MYVEGLSGTEHVAKIVHKYLVFNVDIKRDLILRASEVQYLRAKLSMVQISSEPQTH